MAIGELLDQTTPLFQNETEKLSPYQMNFLRALVDGVRTGFSNAETLQRYNLGTSANVVRLRNALLQKELIEVNGKEVSFADPVFRLWFRREMMF
ncbi:MAG: hypothetical protein LBN24_10185 [Mediterranea sp.]|jgi:hypothetical protein|nr:hypothetical protein [Mediterranea sp.]